MSRKPGPVPFVTPLLLLSVVSVLTVSLAHAAPPFVAASPTCRVSLTQLSYDDADADDAELMVLRVERLTTAFGGGAPAPAPLPAPDPVPCIPPDVEGGSSGLDSGSSLDAASLDAASEPGPLVLGDCGLERLELVSGGSGACDVYRTLPLAEVPVPDDGYVVLCATDSTLAQSGVCDLLAAGNAALKNGWLQNGPADGLRFVVVDGSSVELAYEGSPACFSAAAMTLPEESGYIDASGPSPDDVATLCSGGYTLRPLSVEDLRAPNACNAPPSVQRDGAAPLPPASCTDGGCTSSGAASDSASPDAGRGTWVPELAPGVDPPFQAQAPSYGPGLDLDAAAYQLSERESTQAPAPPGCAVGSVRGAHGSWSTRGHPGLALLAAAVAWLTSRRLRRI